MMQSLFGYLAGITGRKPHYEIYGEQGGIATKCTLPDGFDTTTDRCPMVILMHGFMANRYVLPIPLLAKALAKEGIASISFDFNGNGQSEGRQERMTISNEIADAKAVYDYVCQLPYITEIALLGHSQGGVIAGMLAGDLEDAERKPKCLIQLAPAAVLKDDAIAGKCMGKKYDAKNPPEYVKVLFYKLGREFILEAQQLPIYERSCRYGGKVCLIHGTNDKVVPLKYSQRYEQLYANAELHAIEGENHFMNIHKRILTDLVISFLKKNLL